jgi:hypothetical protein
MVNFGDRSNGGLKSMSLNITGTNEFFFLQGLKLKFANFIGMKNTFYSFKNKKHMSKQLTQ